MTEPTIDRREFLGRCTRAGLSVAAAAGLCIGFFDGTAPEALTDAVATVQIPDFSIDEMSGKICIARGAAQGMDRAATVR